MSASFSGVLPVVGPLADPIRNDLPGPGRCGCREDYGQSCFQCDGSGDDDWEAELAARKERQARKLAMRTDPAFRLAWLLTFPEGRERAEMAAHADRMFGVLREVEERAVA